MNQHKILIFSLLLILVILLVLTVVYAGQVWRNYVQIDNSLPTVTEVITESDLDTADTSVPLTEEERILRLDSLAVEAEPNSTTSPTQTLNLEERGERLDNLSVTEEDDDVGDTTTSSETGSSAGVEAGASDAESDASIQERIDRINSLDSMVADDEL